MSFLNLINSFAITQGKTYQLSFSYPQDITAGILRGQIRDKYAQDNGVLLASFSFVTNYDAVNLKTIVTADITATQTASIAYTKYQEQTDPTIKNCFVYDIEYEENSTVIEILRGLVQVKPETTL